MRVWRVAKAVHATDAAAMLSGTGAALSGGRWNPIGMPVVYCSETSSLAMLETLARIEDIADSPTFGILDLTIPDARIVELPVDEAARNSQQAGAATLKEHLAFAVPSIVNPLERNIVINPRHVKFGEVQPGKVRTFRFDVRLRNGSPG